MGAYVSKLLCPCFGRDKEKKILKLITLHQNPHNQILTMIPTMEKHTLIILITQPIILMI